jgi:hypothetical protein
MFCNHHQIMHRVHSETVGIAVDTAIDYFIFLNQYESS